jgi:hypothetical protein
LERGEQVRIRGQRVLDAGHELRRVEEHRDDGAQGQHRGHEGEQREERQPAGEDRPSVPGEAGVDRDPEPDVVPGVGDVVVDPLGPADQGR